MWRAIREALLGNQNLILDAARTVKGTKRRLPCWFAPAWFGGETCSSPTRWTARGPAQPSLPRSFAAHVGEQLVRVQDLGLGGGGSNLNFGLFPPLWSLKAERSACGLHLVALRPAPPPRRDNMATHAEYAEYTEPLRSATPSPSFRIRTTRSIFDRFPAAVASTQAGPASPHPASGSRRTKRPTRSPLQSVRRFQRSWSSTVAERLLDLRPRPTERALRLLRHLRFARRWRRGGALDRAGLPAGRGGRRGLRRGLRPPRRNRSRNPRTAHEPGRGVRR